MSSGLKDVALDYAGRTPLIHWVAESSKWSDHGNDFWCHAKRDGSGAWVVSSRYGLNTTGSERQREFPTMEEALTFYISYLVALRTTK